jgi:hypothetical protein
MKLTPYEVDIDGLTHTLLLDEEDVKRYPGAKPATGKRTGTPSTPSGDTVEAVLTSVGDDPVKAQAALDTEVAKGDKARSTLVEKLQAVVAAGATS